MWQGLVTASVPGVLFFPSVAFFTICPPQYGLTGMKTVAVLFLFAEIWAGWKLFGVLERRSDWINWLAILGLLVVVVVLAATAWGFIRSAPHASVGTSPFVRDGSTSACEA